MDPTVFSSRHFQLGLVWKWETHDSISNIRVSSHFWPHEVLSLHFAFQERPFATSKHAPENDWCPCFRKLLGKKCPDVWPMQIQHYSHSNNSNTTTENHPASNNNGIIFLAFDSICSNESAPHEQSVKVIFLLPGIYTSKGETNKLRSISWVLRL